MTKDDNASSSDTDIARLEGKVESMDKNVQDVCRTLYGNSREGLMTCMTRLQETNSHILTRFDRIDVRFEAMDKRFDGVLYTINLMDEDVKSINSKLDAHIRDNSKHDLWRMISWKHVIGLLVLFMLAHLIIPKDVTVWELIKLLF